MNSNKDAWIKSLKVGDIVCDCRCRHSKIVEITDERFPRYLLGTGWLIHFLGLSEWYWSWSKKIGFTYVFDRNVVLEDGFNCSAYHCCSDPFTHKEGEWSNYEASAQVQQPVSQTGS